MTEQRAGDSGSGQPLPPISALFLVVFDQKVGYSVAFKRGVADVQVEGVVEYKSLPSGLHNVQSDLVYFVHDDCAGISAFVSRPAGEARRNAHFAAVGVLVPLTYGRLGRSWLHAAALQKLARVAVGDISNTSPLEEYWEAHRIDQEKEQEQDTQKEAGSSKQSPGHRRKTRALSDAAALGNTTHTLSGDHPAISIASHLDMFGPLLFPLYRAALLRKRILILTHAPVREACHLVYNVSVLSNIPSHLADTLPKSNSLPPIRPLFNVGVHDIAYLAGIAKGNSGRDSESRDGNGSYIACSTDEILATKSNIYDMLVELPQIRDSDVGVKQWPKMRTAEGDQVKATQRDVRRYRALRKELQRVEHHGKRRPDQDEDEDDNVDEGEDGYEDEDEAAPLDQTKRSIWEEQDELPSIDGEAELVEPTSWTAMAYTGFLWWASAGEKDAWLEDEASQELDLMADLPHSGSAQLNSRLSLKSGNGASVANGNEAMSAGNEDNDLQLQAQATAMRLIAYTHRLTTLAIEALADTVESGEDTGEDGDEEAHAAVLISSEDLRRMGLDVWSEGDKRFARELLKLYFGREAEVGGQGVECCGLKIC